LAGCLVAGVAADDCPAMGARGITERIASWLRARRTRGDALEVDVVATYPASALVVARPHVVLPVGVAIALRCRDHVGAFVVDSSFDEIDDSAVYYSIRPIGTTSEAGAWAVGARWQVAAPIAGSGGVLALA
jgi:hypothetical protein